MLEEHGLPAVVDSEAPEEDLNAYVGTCLQDEIRNEGLARSIEAFSRFLKVAALHNAEELNFAACAIDAQVPARTVRECFHVLEDTLIGHPLAPFQKTTKRKPVATSKFYWFDTGVANVLVGRKSLARGTPEWGKALEHQVFIELRAHLDYQRISLPLCDWRTTSKLEVDFVVGDSIAIEVKMASRSGP